MNLPTLHTDRLVLRPFHPDDAQDLFVMYSDPQTMRFEPDLPHPSVEFTRQHISRQTSYPGSAYWSLLIQGEHTPIGLAGFIGGSAIPGMGYILCREWWGQGLMAEACQPILAYGFSELGYDRVEMWIEPENRASLRVAEKLGAVLRSLIQIKYNHRPDHHLMLVYGLTAAEWRGKKPLHNPVRLFRSQPILRVRSVVDSIAYFQEKLGFEIEFLYRELPDAPPVHASLACGLWTGSRVVIQVSQARAGEPLDEGSEQYLFVDSQIQDLYDQYKEKGVEILAPLQSYPWGMREFVIRDPDGHRFRFGSTG
jgi:RimJ/RimL family protein N-acetyltransferase/uncharacterized glyoxalase superfamily protein PhnB